MYIPQTPQPDPTKKAAEETAFDRRNAIRALWEISRNVRGSIVNRSLLLAFTLVVLDVLIVAHFQPTTAYALLQHTPPLALLSGVLLSIGPPLLQAAIIWQTVSAGVSFANGYTTRGVQQLFTALAAIGISAIFVDGGQTLAAWLIILLLVTALAVLVFTDRLPTYDEATPYWIGMLIGLGAFALHFTDGSVREALARPHLPAEVVTIQTEREGDSPEEILGYVLQSDTTWTTVMLEHRRHVTLYRTDQVIERQVCETTVDQPIKPAAELFEVADEGQSKCPSP